MNTMPNISSSSAMLPGIENSAAANIVASSNKVSNDTVTPKVTEITSAKPTQVQVEEALDIVNKAAIFEERSLSFKMDEQSGRSIIKVMDKTNDQVIRQIPSEELLKVAQDIKRLQEEMGQSLGVLIDRKV
ncbi:flagellar protein FlaG [Alishewanella tabrizica]|nr:flagellar protein FlaG [Alishewanella tabrizica]